MGEFYYKDYIKAYMPLEFQKRALEIIQIPRVNAKIHDRLVHINRRCGLLYNYKKQEVSYKNVAVCKEWQLKKTFPKWKRVENLRKFAMWFLKELIRLELTDNEIKHNLKYYHIDRMQGIKLYSPDTCQLLRAEINEYKQYYSRAYACLYQGKYISLKEALNKLYGIYYKQKSKCFVYKNNNVPFRLFALYNYGDFNKKVAENARAFYYDWNQEPLRVDSYFIECPKCKNNTCKIERLNYRNFALKCSNCDWQNDLSGLKNFIKKPMNEIKFL